jgi:predicted HicB family RNase H-like nuclease
MGNAPTRIKGTNLYLDPEVVKQAKELAAKRGISLSAFVEKLMNGAVSRTRAKLAT